MARRRYLGYRWLVFVLALAYWLYQFTAVPGGGFGWQFRYLTIWALTASVLSAWFVLRHARGPYPAPDLLASVAAVMNGLVVLLYWRLWFTDPSLVNAGTEPVWWQEYYLHLVGPLLQWIDALILMGAFRQPLRSLGLLVWIFLAYVLWAELVVAPLNSTPVGEVTSGLPYPFLNDQSLAERLAFYGRTAATGLIFVVAGRAALWLRRRFVPAE